MEPGASVVGHVEEGSRRGAGEWSDRGVGEGNHAETGRPGISGNVTRTLVQVRIWNMDASIWSLIMLMNKQKNELIRC